jgi:hypothetical protein
MVPKRHRNESTACEEPDTCTTTESPEDTEVGAAPETDSNGTKATLTEPAEMSASLDSLDKTDIRDSPTKDPPLDMHTMYAEDTK